MQAADRRSPSRRSALTALICVLGGFGIALALLSRPLTHSFGLPYSDVTILVALAVLFAAAEYTRVHIEVKNQALSMTFTDIPLILGLFTLPVWQVMAVRVAAVAVTMLQRRVRPHIALFNLAGYVAETGCAFWLAGMLVPPGSNIADVVLPVLFIACVTAGLGTLGAVIALWILQGRPSAAWSLQALVAVIASGVFSATMALLALPAVPQGPGGLLLLAVVSFMVGYMFWRSGVLLRQRSDQKDLLRAVRAISSVGSAEAVEKALVQQTVDMLRAAHADLEVADAADALPQGGQVPLVLEQSSGTPEERAWLTRRGFRNAVIVPTDVVEGRSALVAHDRFGMTTKFGTRDRWVAETLAAHASLVASRLRLTERLRREASFDHLTQLPNRRSFIEVVQEVLAVYSAFPDVREGDDESARPVVLLADLDRFRAVNDVLGHPAGDRLLTLVAHRLEEVMPPDALLAHYGGDEFAVSLPSATTAQAEQLARAMSESLETTFVVSGSVVDVTASIGIAGADGLHEDEVDAATLLRHVDIALFTAKERDSRLAWYSRDADRGTPERLGLVGQLRRAIHEDQISLVFQPQVSLLDGRVTGFEALARWQDPVRGAVPPEEFVALAEQSGQMWNLTTLALRKAIEQCVTWPEHLGVSVNLPPSLLGQESLPEEVGNMVTEFGLSASRLTVELTESTLMTYQRDTLGPLDVLCAHGVRVSIDDFGTGYSSLAYLQQLPVAEVKIDKAFMTNVEELPTAAALVRSIADVAHALNLAVVAEGVETPETLNVLQELGCDVVQGFVISRPLAPEAVLPWLAAYQDDLARIAVVPEQEQ